MQTDDIKRLSLVPLQTRIMQIIRKHASENPDLEQDLMELHQMVEERIQQTDAIRELASVVVNRL